MEIWITSIIWFIITALWSSFCTRMSYKDGVRDTRRDAVIAGVGEWKIISTCGETEFRWIKPKKEETKCEIKL
jgi:hypothetical protein